MMNWNKNDTKYILKRLILYFLITGIVFFAGQKCAKAETISKQHWSYADTPQSAYLMRQSTQWNVSGAPFKNSNGNLIFTIYQAPTAQGVEIVNEIIVGDGTNKFTCNLGTVGFWNDNNTQRYVTTVVCPVTFNSNGWKTVQYNIPGSNNQNDLYLMTSEYADLTTDTSSAITSMNSQLTSLYNRMDSGFSDIYNLTQQQFAYVRNQLTDIYNVISTSNSGITTAINNQTTSITNEIDSNTSAINDVNSSIQSQTQWQQQNFTSDETQVSAITDLISTGDKNQIRDLLMFPARILMIVGGHISSDYCYSFNLGTLYGTDLVLPCINWKQYVGNDLYNTIDVILSIGIYIGLVIYIRKLLDYVFSLGNTGFNSVNVEVFN